MSQVLDKRFSCDGCAKSYPWKPELTGKKAKCKCGAILTVPDLSEPEPSTDDPPALPDDGIFDFIDSAPEVASTRAEALRGSVAIPVTQAAKPRAAGVAVLPYRSAPTQRERNRERERMGSIHDLKRDVYIPTGLIVGSFLAYFAWLLIHGNANSTGSLAIYGLIMIVMFAVKTVFMIVAAFVVASVASVSFGPFWTAVLKLAAVAIAPDIFATILEEAIGVPGAWMIASALALAFYWILISQLFNMDAGEAWIVVVLFGFLRWVLTFVIGMMLMGMLMSGRGGGAANGAVSGAAALAASTEAMAFDEKIEERKENDLLVEGLEYIAQKGRQSGMTDTINALYAAGARNVWFAVSRDINGKLEPYELIAEWPRDAKKRAAMNTAIADRMKAKAKMQEAQHPDWAPITPDVIVDEGGKYVAIPLGG